MQKITWTASRKKKKFDGTKINKWKIGSMSRNYIILCLSKCRHKACINTLIYPWSLIFIYPYHFWSKLQISYPSRSCLSYSTSSEQEAWRQWWLIRTVSSVAEQWIISWFGPNLQVKILGIGKKIIKFAHYKSLSFPVFNIIQK